MKLQTLQNKVNRVLTGSKNRTSTKDLLRMTESLSIQQMIAHQTLVQTFKIILHSKPKYLSDKIQFKEKNFNLRYQNLTLTQSKYKLNQSKEGFINRGITLFNRLDEQTRSLTELSAFKKESRKWVKKDIPVTPMEY